jgi:hypothetical protein
MRRGPRCRDLSPVNKLVLAVCYPSIQVIVREFDSEVRIPVDLASFSILNTYGFLSNQEKYRRDPKLLD